MTIKKIEGEGDITREQARFALSLMDHGDYLVVPGGKIGRLELSRSAPEYTGTADEYGWYDGGKKSGGTTAFGALSYLESHARGTGGWRIYIGAAPSPLRWWDTPDVNADYEDVEQLAL